MQSYHSENMAKSICFQIDRKSSGLGSRLYIFNRKPSIHIWDVGFETKDAIKLHCGNCMIQCFW